MKIIIYNFTYSLIIHDPSSTAEVHLEDSMAERNLLNASFKGIMNINTLKLTLIMAV